MYPYNLIIPNFLHPILPKLPETQTSKLIVFLENDPLPSEMGYFNGLQF